MFQRVIAVVSLVALPVVALAQEAPPPAPAPAPATPTALTGAGPCKKVLVIAKVQEPAYRRVIEDAFKAEFERKKVEALTGTANLTDADLASADALAAKAAQLGVDGVFGLTLSGMQQDIKDTPSVGVSVGIPVSVGPFSIFAGTNVPLGGGSKVVQKAALRLRFYNKPGQPAYEKVVSETIKSADSDEIAYVASRVAQKTVKELAKQKLIAKP